MATVTLDQAGSANSSMKLKLTYTNGNGNITITGIAGGRDSYGPTSDQNGGNRIYINIGGTTYTVTPSNNTITFGKSYNYVTFWSGSQSRNCEGNQTVTITFYSANGTGNINNSKFTTTINAGYANPTLSVSGPGSSSSNKVTLGTSGANITLSVGNTAGRTCKLKLNGVDTSTTYNSNGDKTFALPASLITQNTGAGDFTATVQIYTGNLSSEVRTVYIHIDDSIKPTVSSLTISASNSIAGFGSYFVQNNSKAVLNFTASGSQGSTVSSYTIDTIGGFNSNLFPRTITTASYTTTNTFKDAGTFTATGHCTDSRSRPSANKTTSSYTVLPYSNPSVISSVQRCDSDGTLNNDGTSCKLHIEYNFAPVNNGSSNLNTKSVEYSLNGSSWESVSLSSWEGTKDVIITSQTFSTSVQYTIYVRYGDRVETKTETKTLEVAYTLISRRAGGKGITFGKIATQDGFIVAMDSKFQDKNGALKSLLDLIYPIGSIYMSVQNVSPQSFLGGTWERIWGRFLLGAQDDKTEWNAGQTGGAENHTPSGTVGGHTLTVNEMPKHGHEVAYYNSSWTTNYVSGGSINAGAWGNWSASGGKGYRTAGTANNYDTYTGGGQSHNHGFTGTSQNTMPPFLAVYIWKRTA